MVKQVNETTLFSGNRETSHRLVNEPSTEPKLAIKTHLDPKDVTEENPYFSEKNKNNEDLKEFFEGENK